MRPIYTLDDALRVIAAAHIHEESWCIPGRSLTSFAVWLWHRHQDMSPELVEYAFERWVRETKAPLALAA